MNFTPFKAKALLLLCTLSLGSIANASDNLLANPGFEFNDGYNYGDFTGWTLSGNVSVDTFVTGITDYTRSGNYGLAGGAVDSEFYLGQTIPTVIGQTYRVSLWLRTPDLDGFTNSFSVTFNGVQLGAETNVNSFDWVQKSYYATATSETSEVKYGFRNDPHYFAADDFSVEAVPEPASMFGLALGGLALIRRRRQRA